MSTVQFCPTACKTVSAFAGTVFFIPIQSAFACLVPTIKIFSEGVVKIAIFHNAKNREAALAAGHIITGNSCIVNYHETDNIWNREYCQSPLKLLDQATHFLFIPYSSDTDVMTFYFLAGFCIGKGIRVIVLETGAALKVPENIRHLATFLSPESFEDFFITEKERFLRDDQKNAARQELLGRGFSCFEENLVLVVNSGDEDAVALFLKAGFDPSIVDSKGSPLLSLAVRAQYPSIVSLLIDAGADINRQSEDRGYSPLMDAAQKGDYEMARKLLECGASPDLKSKDGQTALIICAGRSDEKLSELLVAHGADPTAVDSLGMSASTYARLFHNDKLMALFNTPSP